MPLKIIDFGSREHKDMLELRSEILRKPLGLELDETDTAIDRGSTLIAAYEEDIMLGCCMLVPDGNKLLLRQMAVRNNLQGKGIGRAIMYFAENIARDMGYRELTMYARKNVVGFYEKLGYTVAGNEIIRYTIPHVVMKKAL